MASYRPNLLRWAGALLVAGVLLLVFNLDLLGAYAPIAQMVTAGVLAAGGAGFLLTTLRRRQQWWRVMPGWTLLALAGMMLLATRPDLPRPWIAAALFAGLALAFTHLYLFDRDEHWWAIIPGGFMLVLAAVIALSVVTAQLETLGALLFVGMGLVFGLVYLLGGARHWWALIPGMVLVLFGVLLYTTDRQGDSAATDALLRWWPAALIVLGALLAYLGAGALSPREKLSVNTAPAAKANGEPPRGRLGEYSGPAPGATIEILPDPDEEPRSRHG